MNGKIKDGVYTFKAGETLPNWCSVSPGAQIERGGARCRVSNGLIAEWEVFDNTRVEGDYYLYNKGKEIGKIHIKEKRPIKSEDKDNRKRLDKKALIWIFLLFCLLIFLIAFILNVSY
jgi:hypothetical protein